MFRKPSALFVIPGEIRRLTGGSVYNRKLIESLSARGFQLEVVAVPDLPYVIGLIAGLAISARLLLRLATRTFDVVIVDGWSHHTTLLFLLMCRLTKGAPLVLLVHQVRSKSIRPPARSIARLIEPIAFGSAQLIVTVSAFVSSQVERLVGGSERVLVALPGSAPLSGSTQRNTHRMPLRLLFVGNCTPVKGLDHLIGALGLVQDLPVALDVAGDVGFEPRYYRRLMRQARALCVSERIVFHGAMTQEALGSLYATADIFVLPSLYEGFGLVLAEAMHSGLPIIATRTGAADEILREDENALIVPAADSPALADAIRRLAADSSMRADFGRRSLELAKSLSTWKQTADNICHRIEAMIRTSPDRTQMMKEIPKR